MSKTYSYSQISHWFLRHGSFDVFQLTQLLCLSHAWMLVVNNQPLFKNTDFKAGANGFVSNELFHIYPNHHDPIKTPSTQIKLNKHVEEILQQILDVYGQYSHYNLEHIIHNLPGYRDQRQGLKPLEPGKHILTRKDYLKLFN